MQFNKFIAYSLSVLLLASCVSSNPSTGGYTLSFMSEEEEYELGHDIVSKEIKANGLYKENKELSKYFQQLGRDIVDVGERSEMPLELIMVDSPTQNAWAIPGYINIYRGILPFFNSEAELVAVMAHESGHINARHTVRQQAKGTLASAAILIGTAIVAAKTNDSLSTAAAYGIGVAGATLAMAAYSREYEDEADELATKYMDKLGYDPRQAYEVFNTFGRLHELRERIYKYFNDGEEMPKSKVYDLLSSHPEPEDRMAHVEKLVGTPSDVIAVETEGAPVGTKQDPNNQEKFFDMIDGLSYGPKPEYGVFGRDVYYNAKNRFVINLPSGFYAEWKPNGSWQAYNNATLTSLGLKFSRLSKGQDSEEKLRVLFPKLRQLEPIYIGDNEGYTGVQYVYEKKMFGERKLVGVERVFGFPTSVEVMEEGEDAANKSRRFAIFTIYHKSKGEFERLDGKFFDAVRNARILTADEANDVEPLRIDIYTVKTGDTVRSLSEKMAMGDLREELFRVMNGLDRDEEVTVGSKVKLVVDPNTNKFK